MKYFCLILLVLLIDFSGYCQTKKNIFFTGSIMDQDGLMGIPKAKFRVNNNFAGITNESGKFSLWASRGDTISYSHLGFKKMVILVSDSLIDNNYLLGVFMSRDTINLHEVLVVPRFSSLKEELENTKVNTPAYVNAVNNVNSATYHALTKPASSENMDAQENANLMQKHYISKTVNKTFIYDDLLFGVSTGTTVKYYKNIKRKRILEPSNIVISDQEIEIIKKLLQYK